MRDGLAIFPKPEGTENQTWAVRETAQLTGLSVHTLRYYERANLLPRVGRGATSGHRRFTACDIQFIEFLKRLRAAGMPISEMQRYVSLLEKGDCTLEERHAMPVEHGQRVRQQIAELQSCLSVIDWKVEHYRALSMNTHNGNIHGVEPLELEHVAQNPCDREGHIK